MAIYKGFMSYANYKDSGINQPGFHGIQQGVTSRGSCFKAISLFGCQVSLIRSSDLKVHIHIH